MKVEKLKMDVPVDQNRQRVFAMPESLKDLYQDEKDPTRIASTATAAGASASAVAPSTSVSVDF